MKQHILSKLVVLILLVIAVMLILNFAQQNPSSFENLKPIENLDGVRIF